MNTNFLDAISVGCMGARIGSGVVFPIIATTDVYLTWTFVVFCRIDNL